MKKNYLLLLILSFIGIFSQVTNAQSDQYLHFDGTDDFVNLTNGSQYIADAEGITMAGWFYNDALGYGQGMLDFRNGDSEFYVIQLNDGVLECRYIPNGDFHEIVTPSFTVIPEQWQFMAFVFTGSEIIMYMDGQVVGTAAASGTFDATDVDFRIGSSTISCCDFYYQGGIDEVSLWSKALTQEAIMDIMENELNGDEEGLELYYKFNQGVPDEDNTSIAKAICEVGDGERDADIIDFALTGTTSNFTGEVDLGFQAITFPQIPNKLISDEPFEINAEASSGLPVTYEIVSGPATIDGNVITLTGEVGEVVVQASQEGDATFDPAETILVSFQVLDPNTFIPTIEARSPLEGDVHVPELSAIHLAAISNIDYPELFNVSDLVFEIDGVSIPATDWENGHYTAWWLPSDYGTYTIAIKSKNNYDAEAIYSYDIAIVEEVESTTKIAVDAVVLDSNNPLKIIEADLPSYLGAFSNITATLDINCPPGEDCDPWDRVSSIDVKGHNGQWVEIIRYITSYGTACESTIDLTDYMSILQGRVTFRITYVTFADGFEYNLILDYEEGTPDYKYSTVDVLWQETFPFGDYANLQPVPPLDIQFSEDAEASTLKLVATGHGWADNLPWQDVNTDNAAEFYEATHHIHVDGVETFEQHNWNTCNPNPDECQPQAGSWQFPRAGWCPGTIAPWFDFNMTEYLGEQIELKYVFDEDYVDLCHPNHPDCIDMVTCTERNCSDGVQPELIVSSNLVIFANLPLEEFVGTIDTMMNDTMMNDTMDTGLLLLDEKAIQLHPNPSSGIVILTSNINARKLDIKVMNPQGQIVAIINKKNVVTRDKHFFDLSEQAKGIYFVEIVTENGKTLKKLILD